MRYFTDIFTFVYIILYYTSISISFYIYNMHDSSVKGVGKPRPLVLVNYCTSTHLMFKLRQLPRQSTEGHDSNAVGGSRRRPATTRLTTLRSSGGTHNGITVLTHLDARNIRDSFRRVVVCHDVSICQHVLLIRQRTYKHTELFPDFERVHLMLANLHGEFGLGRIAPNAGAKKSESLEYFNALASPNIKFILRKPFDIAAVRIAMWTTKLQQLAKARLPKSADPPKLQAGLHLWIILACQQTIDTNGETPLEQGVNKPSLQGQRQPDDTIAAVQCRLAFSLLIFLAVSDINQGQGNTFELQSLPIWATTWVAWGEVRWGLCCNCPLAPTSYLYIYE